MKKMFCAIMTGVVSLSMTNILASAEEVTEETVTSASSTVEVAVNETSASALEITQEDADETLANVSVTSQQTPSKTWGATSQGHSFSKEWEVTKDLYVRDVSGRIGQMKYGYDTDLLNEDYCSCYFVDHNSRAAIYRSGHDTEEGSMGNPAVWSKVEVHHVTSTVTYYAQSYGEW